MASGVASLPAIATAGSPGSNCSSMNTRTAKITITGMACSSRKITPRNMFEPIGISQRLLQPRVPEAEIEVGPQAADPRIVVTAQRAGIGHLDHIGLVEEAALDREPRVLARLLVDRFEQAVERRVDRRVLVDMREGVDRALPLLRAEQRRRAEAGGRDIPVAGAALQIVGIAH